jgi:hypothetical protein
MLSTFLTPIPQLDRSWAKAGASWKARLRFFVVSGTRFGTEVNLGFPLNAPSKDLRPTLPQLTTRDTEFPVVDAAPGPNCGTRPDMRISELVAASGQLTVLRAPRTIRSQAAFASSEPQSITASTDSLSNP